MSLEKTAPGGEGDMEQKVAIALLIHDLHRLFDRAFDDKLRDLGLTRAQWRVMLHLLRGDGMTQKELAQIDCIEKAPMGRLLDKLEETGWIVRRPDPRDGRARRVFRTDKIDPLLPDIKASAAEVFAVAFEGISEADRAALMRGLDDIRENLSLDQPIAPRDPARQPPRQGAMTGLSG